LRHGVVVTVVVIIHCISVELSLDYILWISLLAFTRRS